MFLFVFIQPGGLHGEAKNFSSGFIISAKFLHTLPQTITYNNQKDKPGRASI